MGDRWEPPDDGVEFMCSDGVVRTWAEMCLGIEFRTQWDYDLVVRDYGAVPVDPYEGWDKWRGPRLRLVKGGHGRAE